MVELNYGFYFWLFGAVILAQLAYDFLCMIGESFGSFLDFTKTYKDLGFKYLSFVFRRGKHIRFPKDFPSDLREACLGKNSYYLENEDDLKKGNEARRQAKSLVRAVLTNDELINEYLKGQYFTYEDFLSLKETIGLADVQEQRNIIAYLKGKLKYVNAAETIHEIIVAEMTNRDLDIPVGKRQAALYYALSMEGCVDNWTQKEFVDFIKMLSMVNPEVKGVNSPTMSHHLNSVAVKQDSKYIRAKIKKSDSALYCRIIVIRSAIRKFDRIQMDISSLCSRSPSRRAAFLLARNMRSLDIKLKNQRRNANRLQDSSNGRRDDSLLYCYPQRSD